MNPDTPAPQAAPEPNATEPRTAAQAVAVQPAGAVDPALYGELRRAAHGIRSGVRAGDTLQTTALIHEAYLKLARGGQWQDRGHFLAAAALAMRQVLVDDARARLRLRRGSGERPLSLDDDTAPIDVAQQEPDAEVIAVGEALETLAQLSPRLAQVVECRYFAGYTEAETALALDITERTVRRDWVKARAWLYQALTQDARDG